MFIMAGLDLVMTNTKRDFDDRAMALNMGGKSQFSEIDFSDDRGYRHFTELMETIIFMNILHFQSEMNDDPF